MSQRRTLTLKTETLADLTTDDLRGLAGGAQALSRADGKCTFDRSYLPCSWDCPATFPVCY